MPQEIKSESRKYSSKSLGRPTIFYLLIAITLSASILYLILFIQYSLNTAVTIDSVAIICYGLSLLLIRCWKYQNVIRWLFTVYITHLVTVSCFALPREAGFQYFLFAVPPAIFLSSEYEQYTDKIFFTAISILLFLLIEIGYVNFFSLPINESIIKTLFITTIICLQLGVTFVVFLFTYELNKSEIELQKANDDLKRLSNLDGLTNLYNRRYFDIILTNEWKRHSRTKSPLSMILCDIDYFKKYNDTYGHLAGDDCLKKVSEAIKNSLKRPSDIVARYGGEEIVVILTETNLMGALEVTRDIKLAIENLQIEHVASSVKSIITLSFGVATVTPQYDQQPETLISLADSVLYQSKEKGRDQIQQTDLIK